MKLKLLIAVVVAAIGLTTAIVIPGASASAKDCNSDAAAMLAGASVTYVGNDWGPVPMYRVTLPNGNTFDVQVADAGSAIAAVASTVTEQVCAAEANQPPQAPPTTTTSAAPTGQSATAGTTTTTTDPTATTAATTAPAGSGSTTTGDTTSAPTGADTSTTGAAPAAAPAMQALPTVTVSAVKVTANRTGASASPTQGVFAIH